MSQLHTGSNQSEASPTSPTLDITPSSPLTVYSPAKGSDREFDPHELIDVLGEPGRYESAVLITYRSITEPEEVECSWGTETADPETDVIARPYIQDLDGNIVPAGKEYPLKKTELRKREETELSTSDGEQLLKKPGETSFFKIPESLDGAIHIYSPESSLDGDPQVARVGDIIAFTEAGPWVMAWDDAKFKEV